MIVVPNSRFGRWLLNRKMSRIIPFNRPHGITIVSLKNGHCVCCLPFIKRNFNHLGGLHACALATVAEYSAGLLLVNAFDMKCYRIIMVSINVKYHRQGLMDCLASSQCVQDVMDDLKNTIKAQGKGLILLESLLHDVDGHLLATVNTKWQLKLWKKIN